MSTQYKLHEDGDKVVEINKSSAKYDLDLWGYSEDPIVDGEDPPYVLGPQGMSAQEALKMAANIIYAVWCSYPDEAESMAWEINECIPVAVGRG